MGGGIPSHDGARGGAPIKMQRFCLPMGEAKVGEHLPGRGSNYIIVIVTAILVSVITVPPAHCLALTDTQ